LALAERYPDLMRTIRQKIAFGHDLIMAFLSLPIAMFLRLGPDIFFYDINYIIFSATIFMITSGSCFLLINLYGGIWRYASLNDLTAILKAVTLSILFFVLLMFVFNRLEWTPRSTLFINWFVLAALLGGPRLLYRQFKDQHANKAQNGREGTRKIPVLLVGAADGAELFIRAITRNTPAAYQVIGILGETANRVGRNIHGVKVLGKIDDLPTIYKKLELVGTPPERIIVTKEDIEKPTLRELISQAENLGISIAKLPRLTDFHTNIKDTLPIRTIAIEDVLGRAQQVLDRTSMRDLVDGKRILVTGAGGTIGAELSRQIAEFGPARLCLLDASEYALYSVTLEIEESYPEVLKKSVIADIRDRGRISQVFTMFKPDLVFHAAALKHVPIVEDDPSEGILTNVYGTKNIADLCCATGVSAMVLISTDKAVNPTSIMGATKRIAETYCQALDMEETKTTRFITVRFGNVLGSTGSVVPLFQRQLSKGGPLTVTHPDMKRYFMTVREAVELVLEATALGRKPNNLPGRVYVLDMGEPIKIIDLARQMILLAGFQPNKEIKIEFTGLRPGEKLSEELLHDSEPPENTSYDGIMLAAPRTIDIHSISEQIGNLAAAARAGKIDEIASMIKEYVPEFQPKSDSACKANDSQTIRRKE